MVAFGDGRSRLEAALIVPNHSEDIYSKIDESLQEIQFSVSKLGRLLGELRSSHSSVNESKKRQYEVTYRMLSSALVHAPRVNGGNPGFSMLQRQSCEPIFLGTLRSNSFSSNGFSSISTFFCSVIAVDEQDRAENDVFWVRLIRTYDS